jgi:hypothetical protein
LYRGKYIITNNKNSKKDAEDFYQIFKKKAINVEKNKICKYGIFKNRVKT